MNTNTLLEFLRSRYLGNAWAYFEEVPATTGSASTRRCDALAIGLWPSKGLHIHGHEVKVTRADWQREMQNISKSEKWLCHCHYWWVVAPKNIVELTELPSTWGLMEATKSGLRVKSMPTKKEDPIINISLLATICRQVHRNIPGNKELKEARSSGWSDGYKKGKQEVVRHNSTDSELNRKRYEQLEKDLREFERASGVRINGWNGRKMGEAVKAVLASSSSTMMEKANRIDIINKQLADTIEQLRNGSQEIK